MTEKYYTPALNEFNVGFEYEMKSGFWDGTVKTLEQYNEAKWEKHTVIVGSLPYIERTISGRNSDNLPPAIRVKYLDEIDIESLGYELDKNASLYGDCFRFTIFGGLWPKNGLIGRWMDVDKKN